MAEKDNNNRDEKVLNRIKALREEIYALENKSTQLTDKENNQLNRKLKALDKVLDKTKSISSSTSTSRKDELELNSIFSTRIAELGSMSTMYSNLAKSQKNALKLSQDSLVSVQSSLTSDEAKKGLLNETLTGVFKLQDLQKKLAETGPEQVDVQKSIIDAHEEEYNKLIENIVAKAVLVDISKDELEALIKVLELQKDSLSVADKLSQQSQKQKQSIEDQNKLIDYFRKAFGGLAGTMETAFSNLKAFFGTILIALGDVVGKLGEMNKSLGMSLADLGEFQLSAVGLGYIFKDASSVAEGLATQFGSMEKASFGLQFQTNLLATNLGISGDEAASLTKTFSMLNGGSTDVAADMMVSARETAKMAGVIPSKVMKDLAKNTEAFALHGKNGGKNIAEAAVYAAKLGVEMDSLTKVTDNLLDFESSITKELELSAMLGRSINLDRARALAYEGDIQGAVNETLNQLGGIEAFNQMDYYQKKQTADLLGVSVAELQKMADNQSALTGEVGLLQKGYSKFTESVTALGNTFAGTVMQGAGGFLIYLGQINMGLSALGLNLATMFKRMGAWLLWPFKAIGGWIMKTGAITKNTIATKVNTVATTAWNGVTKLSTAIMNLSIVSWLKERLAIIASTAVRYINIAAVAAWNLITKISSGLMNLSIFGWAREKLAILGSTAMRWANIAAIGAWNIITKIVTVIMALFTLGLFREKAALAASTAAKSANSIATTAWNMITKVSNALMNISLVGWAREKLALVFSTGAKWANIAATAAWNTVMGISNAIKSTSIARWVTEKALIVASTVAKWLNVGATAAVSGANTLLAGSQTAVATTAAPAAAGITTFGASLLAFGGMVAPVLPVILGLALAVLMITPAFYVLGRVIIGIATAVANVLIKALEMIPLIISSIAKSFTEFLGSLSMDKIGLLYLLAPALIVMGLALMALGNPLAVLGIGVLLGLGYALVPFTDAVSKLGGIDMGVLMDTAKAILLIGSAVSLIGPALPLILMGSLSLFALGYALMPFTKALSALAGIDIGAMLAFSQTILSIGHSVSLLGIMSPLIVLGAIAMGALTLALIPFVNVITKLTSVDPTIITAISNSLISIGLASFMIVGGLALLTIGLLSLVNVFPVLYAASIVFGMFGATIMIMAIATMILASSLPIIMTSLQQMVEFTDGILGLSDAILKLSISMGSLSFASAIMIPLLPVITAIGAVSSLFGGKGGEEGGAGEDGGTIASLESTVREVNDALLAEIKGLRDDLNSGKISVNMDGDSVTSKIVKNINRSAANAYGVK